MAKLYITFTFKLYYDNSLGHVNMGELFLTYIDKWFNLAEPKPISSERMPIPVTKSV